jgi:3-hydroxyisobutyrate dehydrogenase
MLKNIGFIGLGTVGRYMAANLTKGNYNVTVYDKVPELVEELKRVGATAATSPMEAAKGKDLVIVIRPESEDLHEVVYGEKGVFKGIDPGTILVDMGTHSLDLTLKLAEDAPKHRVMFLEAPVWGSKEHASNGLLTILAGGDPSLIGRCREPFSCFGLNIIHVGKVGDATLMKMIVNLIQAEMMVSLAEGILFAEKLGFSVDKLLEVLDSGGVASPLFHSKGRSIIRGDFSRNLALKYIHEQLQQVKDAARKHNLSLPAAEVVGKIYEQGIQDGRGEEDFSAVIKVLRK